MVRHKSICDKRQIRSKKGLRSNGKAYEDYNKKPHPLSAPAKSVDRRCLKCQETFSSDGLRICPECTEVNDGLSLGNLELVHQKHPRLKKSLPST